jgi:multiple sugar transport system substrate-binding protein
MAGRNALAVIFVLVLIAGCACDKRAPVARNDIRVAVREGLEADGIRKLATEWGKRRGAMASVQAFGRDNYEVDTTNDLLSENPEYDVVFFPGTLVPDMAQRGALEPIHNWSPDSDRDLLAHTSYDGKVYGLPCDISTFFLYYRADVVKTIPETWTDLLREAPKYTHSKNPSVPTAYGLALGAKAGEDLIKGFYVLLWSYGGYIIENGQVGLDTPGALEAGRMLRRLVTSPAVPPDIQTWEVTKILDQLQRGTVAISAPEWNALYPLLMADTTGFGKKVEIAQIPGVRQPDGQVRRVNFRQTWDLVMAHRSRHLQAANDFLLFATSADGGRIYAESAHGNPARISLLSDPVLQRARPEFPLLLESLKISKAEPEVPYYPRLSRIVNDALSGIVAGTATPDAALTDAAQKVRGLK